MWPRSPDRVTWQHSAWHSLACPPWSCRVVFPLLSTTLFLLPQGELLSVKLGDLPAMHRSAEPREKPQRSQRRDWRRADCIASDRGSLHMGRKEMRKDAPLRIANGEYFARGMDAIFGGKPGGIARYESTGGLRIFTMIGTSSNYPLSPQTRGSTTTQLRER